VQWREELTRRAGGYVYDTAQKLDAFSTMMLQASLDEKLPPDDREYMIDRFTKKLRPLAVVGPVTVFIDTDSGAYLVSESREDVFVVPLLEIEENHNQIRMTFSSRIEKGFGKIARFGSMFYYTKDDKYERGDFFIHGGDGDMKIFRDTKGIGVFDEMIIAENGIRDIYRLNGLSWEKIDEQPLNDSQDEDDESK
jgi:hypothetical protein